jgi:hypothetical protein
VRNMGFAAVDDLVVAVHSAAPPSEEEWAGYIATMRKIGPEKVCGLAFTDGGAPDSKQRKLLNDVLGGRPRIAAVVSGSTLVRSVVTALTWFNPDVKAFSPDRVNDAYAYLKLTTAQIEAVNRQVQVLHKQFAAPLKCIPA